MNALCVLVLCAFCMYLYVVSALATLGIQMRYSHPRGWFALKRSTALCVHCEYQLNSGCER